VTADEVLREAGWLTQEEARAGRDKVRRWALDHRAILEGREEFIELVLRQAFTTNDGRDVLHTMRGSFGADWDVEQLIDAINDPSNDVRWTAGLMMHFLRVGPLLVDVGPLPEEQARLFFDDPRVRATAMIPLDRDGRGA
jgi:hypothetical protein